MPHSRNVSTVRAGKKSARKIRMTVSLQEETVRFLRRRKDQVQAASMSACVEDVVAACRRMVEAEELNRQTRAYYDGISDEERAEEMAWGKMAEQEFQRVGRAERS
jgi:hypothetical protein